MYMAPEMIRHELYTTKADVYSWGVLLAECLAQRPPYEGLYLTPVQVHTLPGLSHIRHEPHDICRLAGVRGMLHCDGSMSGETNMLTANHSFL